MFTGSVSPSKAGHAIYLQKLGKDGDWHTVEVRFVNNASTFQFGWTFGTMGTKEFRARITGGPANVGGASAPVTVVVSQPPLSTLPTELATTDARSQPGEGWLRGGRRPASATAGAGRLSGGRGGFETPAARRLTRVASRRMDFALTDEQQLIKETARRFTDNEIVPRSRDNDRNAHFDTELVAKIAEQGYLGAIVPQEYGGAGLDYLSYGLIVEEIGRGDSSMRTVVSVQTSLVCSAIVRWGTEEQKRRYLPKLCSGRVAGVLRPDRARHRL